MENPLILCDQNGKFKMALLLIEKNKCTKLFWNPYINAEVMVWTNPDGRVHTLTQMCMQEHTLTKWITVSKATEENYYIRTLPESKFQKAFLLI